MKRYLAEVLTRHEIEALLRACSTDSWTDRRNYALLVLLWRTGLRILEALALRPCDVKLERGAIRVLRGKGGRARTVGIDRAGRRHCTDGCSNIPVLDTAPVNGFSSLHREAC